MSLYSPIKICYYKTKKYANFSCDELPDYFIAFDVYSFQERRYLDLKAKTKFLNAAGLAQAPVLYEGKIKKEEIPDLIDKTKAKKNLTFAVSPCFQSDEKLQVYDENNVDNKKSNFSSFESMEGCVIKDYRKQLFVKYVAREFPESGDWTSEERAGYNKLRSDIFPLAVK